MRQPVAIRSRYTWIILAIFTLTWMILAVSVVRFALDRDDEIGSECRQAGYDYHAWSDRQREWVCVKRVPDIVVSLPELKDR